MSLFFAGCLLIAGSGPLRAQFTTASFSGTVLDPGGAVVPAADVHREQRHRADSHDANGCERGISLSHPAGWNIHIAREQGRVCYVRARRYCTDRESGRASTITLRVGAISEQVLVSADAELVSTTRATLGQTVSTAQVVDLPLDGRTAQSLVFLASGAVDTTDRYCGLGCHGGVYPGEQLANINGRPWRRQLPARWRRA